ACLLLPTAAPAQQVDLLSVDRVFGPAELREEGLDFFQWGRRGATYYTLEAPRDGGEGRDLVRHDTATGSKEVLGPARAVVPPGETRPLRIDGLQFSRNEDRLLIYTNSQRVWRQNTRGDYWVLDLASRELRKLGGDAAASTLMFAKFSPDASRVAYV